ncbi:hypothetical protein ACU686_03140 [Yinghuangia aomiensis]
MAYDTDGRARLVKLGVHRRGPPVHAGARVDRHPRRPLFGALGVLRRDHPRPRDGCRRP